VRTLGVRCNDDCPIINTPLRQLSGLFPDLNIIVVGIVRNGEGFVPSPSDQMLAGDDVYFVVSTDRVARAMAAFGHEEAVARRIIIAGGGNIGTFLGGIIEREHAGVSAKIIEYNAERAHRVADILDRTVVIQGNVIDPEILEEAGVAECEAIIAVTNDDETNILASLLAKRNGTQRAMTLVSNVTYGPLITSLGIDVVVSPRAITASTILQHVRRGRIRAVHSLGDDFGELIEAEIMETSGLTGRTIAEAALPDGIMFGAVVRDGEVIMPRSDTVMRVNDRVVLFARAGVVRAVEKLFAVRLEFF